MQELKEKEMNKKDKLVKAVDDAYIKVLEADEAHDQAVTVLEYYEEQLKEQGENE